MREKFIIRQPPIGEKDDRSMRKRGCRSAAAAGTGEREKFIIRQPPIGEKDDYDCENSQISEGLHSTSRRKSRGEGRGKGGRGKEKTSASQVNVGVDGAKSEIKVARRRVPK